MNQIHSGILALVLGIFLIQAADPPYERNTNFLPYTIVNYLPVSSQVTSIEARSDDQPPETSNAHPEDTTTPQYNGRILLLDDQTGESNNPNFKEEHVNLKVFHHYLKNIKKRDKTGAEESIEVQEPKEPAKQQDVINDFLQRQGKTEYEKLLERDFIRPLLKLYESKGYQSPDYVIGNFTNNSRISKEDYENKSQKFLTREELDLLIHETDKFHENLQKNSNIEHLEDLKLSKTEPSANPDGAISENAQKFSRRDDNLEEDTKDEHIGEILPPNFSRDHSMLYNYRGRVHPKLINVQRKSYRSSRKYDSGFVPSPFTSDKVIRKPISFPRDRFRPEYEPTSISYEGFDSNREDRSKYIYPSDLHEGSINEQESRNVFSSIRIGPPNSEIPGYRLPRRLRGFSDSFPGFQITGRDAFYDPSTRWQNGWTGSRKPKVIFPTDLVAFRDSNPVSAAQDETDWLAADSALQDLQEPDIRERGTDLMCISGASCEFFLTCWLSGGQLESPCDGFLRGCCQKGASKAGQSPSLAVGTLEAPRESAKSVTTLDDTRCGISSPRQQAQRRIVGGEEAGFGTFPWQAYIRIGSSRCGGSLVSRRHVVTAGHCVARATPRQVHVTLGDYVINSAVEPLPAYTFGVSQIQVHPFFKFTPQADRFDVAVLRLDRTAHQLPHITPICLPPRGETFLGETGVAAGWGALSPGSRLRPQTLQAVQVPVIDNRICERWHRSKGIGVTIYDEMMCAGYKTGGRDSCQGDSGGPLMLQRQGRWYLIGIVSAGYSCAQPGQPGIYHRVAHTVEWINRAITS
ncbi:uncharacterized protein LOC123306898 isoform X1 [Coccinella septempunctata]|uniref:uncharacterized protein LOC123306898 isoform X1 n=1 Tax=Coccinella septempunctata TaxID=41139 RepID=UPI001D08353C|nr:uncharacterized protein LOC123306898 isoform X1 [Coccinella septempunctata]